VLAELRDSVLDPSAGPADTTRLDPLDALHAAFEVVRRDEQKRPGHQLAFYELTALALRTPALRDLARRQYQAYREVAAAAAGPWLQTRHVDVPGGAEALTRLLAVLFDGISLAWLADPEGTNPDELFTLIVDLIEARLPPAPSP
jgi:hypothetical protein